MKTRFTSFQLAGPSARMALVVGLHATCAAVLFGCTKPAHTVQIQETPVEVALLPDRQYMAPPCLLSGSSYRSRMQEGAATWPRSRSRHQGRHQSQMFTDDLIAADILCEEHERKFLSPEDAAIVGRFYIL
jgi:hypothetical protein